ncbi:ZmpA/ZmpB/ZmpC family metallo-endopeptidase-related protein [Paenibacillus sp. JX-17]|uniref:ZmpA/ZmpB/ZmpC family metallo-endopeptidase-related protein n=1 Tax=Paenibacillus lacisoli TaxID=3064525 RepID=A0ABT9CIZ6_9BACL|nr:ZmpA/ZmpB/ZmpC family metallo-endopeptidase-related protein [Paenibacillus sp. JX-17]MDO7907646.1 ZmpA/ZmpB/ZmpC family metallo-endopeptidase-related protein [Paenibacillus sp. JX-17]
MSKLKIRTCTGRQSTLFPGVLLIVIGLALVLQQYIVLPGNSADRKPFLIPASTAFTEYRNSHSQPPADHLIYINTPQDLDHVRSGLSGHYILNADLNLTGYHGDLNLDWLPIGDEDHPFTGTLEGRGHSISGMTIVTLDNNAGLFGSLHGASITNLKLDAVSVHGQQHVGALAGSAYSSLIKNISAAGNVIGVSKIGDIAGETDRETRLTNCTSRVRIDHSSGQRSSTSSRWLTVNAT